MKLLPYPQEVQTMDGRLPLGPPEVVTDGPLSDTERLACRSLKQHLPRGGKSVIVRLGSVAEGFDESWLPSDDRAFVARDGTSPEASVLRITPEGITVVGKGEWGMLYGAQTVNQLAIEAVRTEQDSLPCVAIRDWPDMSWRCLSPQLTWYSGWNRLEGYDCGNWTEDEWRWLADWSLLHKCNAWAVCMYGYWPFRLPGHEEETLNVESPHYSPRSGQKELRRFVHPNIRDEFFDEVIEYANKRGIKVHAYIGKNSFNGADFKTNPDKPWGGAAELIPFEPGVEEYWDAVIGKIVDLGFDGFVLEDPETNHVPNRNEQCYRTFWEPWAERYGFSSVEETEATDPPLGVHIEYYTWLFREFDRRIQEHGKRVGIEPEVYLISHMLMSRVISESAGDGEFRDWVKLIDEKQGRKVPYIMHESNEARYVDALGSGRIASLGGRGGSCTNAMRRIASVNNNWLHGGMGGDIVHDIDAQTRIREAGGLGAMGYVFEWTNTEVFGYIASQYLWKNAGPPGIDKRSQVDFLDYAYRTYYGDEVGHIAARVFDEGACVNDAMVFEDVYGSQWPSTGRALSRDHQYLAVLADRSEALAREAYRSFTGHDPELYRPAYEQSAFRWKGYDREADHTFKAERLRWLWVSCRRSQELCAAALAYGKAQSLMAQGATVGEVLGEYDRAIEHATSNQLIYQLNYEDDYDATDGLCSRVTDRLLAKRKELLVDAVGGGEVLIDWTFDRAGDLLGWSETHDLPELVADGDGLIARTGDTDPQIALTGELSVPVNERCAVEVEMASDRADTAEVFWRTTEHPTFSEPPERLNVAGDGKMHVYRAAPPWDGSLLGLRIDPPRAAKVTVRAIRVVEAPEPVETAVDRSRPVSQTLSNAATPPVLHIPWEKQTDITPNRQYAGKPGIYLSTDVGLDRKADYFRLGVVFTVECQREGGQWQPIFRRALSRRHEGWEHWDIPVADDSEGDDLRLRLCTDSYSRAQIRSEPSWKWAYWGSPQLIRIRAGGSRQVVADLVSQAGEAQTFVRLDSDGQDRPMDGDGVDTSGAAFRPLRPGPVARTFDQFREEDGRERQWVDGFSEWSGKPPHRGGYRHWLGLRDSGWAYSRIDEHLAWLTDAAPSKMDTSVPLIGGTSYEKCIAELWCNDEHLLTFETGSTDDARWREDEAQLRFTFGGDTRDERTPYGLSGLFVVRVPARIVVPGEPLRMRVKLRSGDGGAWFMVHGYEDAEDALQPGHAPLPTQPALAAFTPHAQGQFGLTIGEYTVPLR